MHAVRTFVFNLSSADLGKRLDALVVALLAREGVAASRSAVQLWIEHGRVLLEGTPVLRASSRVRAGVLSVTPEAPPPTTAAPEPSIKLKVLFEDEHLIVIDKPAGLVVHPARGHATGTLVNGLLALHGFERAPIDDADPEGQRRPGIVHRLDKDTSGVLVVARTVEAREGLKELFRRHDLTREYWALVVGKARDATYDTLLGRHRTDRLRFTTRTGGLGKRALTRVRVLESFAELATLVSCRLETGRTHQIRVHLSECGGTPLLGDAVYGGRVRDAFLARLGRELGRQWLHALVLGFRHPITGEDLRFTSSLPPELVESLEKVRLACERKQ